VPAISQHKVRQFLKRSAKAATTKAKGQIFEDLVCYLFEKVPGITVSKRDVLNPYHSEEIDISFWNDKVAGGFNFLPNTFLVEAKNWSVPAGAQEIAHFTAKLEERDLGYGFFVAMNGISGSVTAITAARDKVRLALIKKIRIIVIKRTDIETFKSGGEIAAFVKSKLCELAASGTQFD
jgi:hypothetical protein